MDLKRVLELIIIFLIVLFIYQFVVIHFENKHDIVYKLGSDKYEFVIDEKYFKDKKNDGYLVNIEVDGKKYIYYFDNLFNKRKKIISEIKTYEKNDYLCIYPLSIDSDVTSEILCNDGQGLYSYAYVNQNNDISEFAEQLDITKNFTNNLNDVKEDNGISIYKGNLYENEYLEIYRYKYLMTFNKDELSTYNFSNKDIYRNDLGVYLDNYFMIPTIDNNKITSYLVVNILNKKTRTIKFEKELSQNIYNLGVFDNKLYIFDLNNKVEYEIDPKNNYRIFGDTSSGFKINENGKWIEKSVTEFTNNKITFINNFDLKNNYDNVYEADYCYYGVEGNKVYKIYKGKEDVPILLIDIKNPSTINVANDSLYYIDESVLYRYDKNGIKTLVDNNEFKYNNFNIYYVYNE